VLPLGPGSKLAVVEFAGQQILLAVSRGAITRLADNSQGDFHAD
jgi:flagellar protein FliO/FliZ